MYPEGIGVLKERRWIRGRSRPPIKVLQGCPANEPPTFAGRFFAPAKLNHEIHEGHEEEEVGNLYSNQSGRVCAIVILIYVPAGVVQMSSI